MSLVCVVLRRGVCLLYVCVVGVCLRLCLFYMCLLCIRARAHMRVGLCVSMFAYNCGCSQVAVGVV